MSDAEVIDIGSLDALPTISFGDGGGKKGLYGADLLMNTGKMTKGEKSGGGDIDLGELSDLENELNDLTDSVPKRSSREMRSDFFGGGSGGGNNDYGSNGGGGGGSGLGSSTANTDTDTKTWDGFQKFNNIPLDPDAHVAPQPQLTKEEMLREKFKMLKKLEELESKGVSLSKKYSMESSLSEMKGEYETQVEERERQNSIKFQGKMMLACITGLEFLNNRFDPFDFKLDGWAEQVGENITEYDEIFSELHEKYKSKAKMAPELKLLFQLGGSALMLHMTNSMFKSALPGMDDIMRQNPELMQQFTQAAVNTMSQNMTGSKGGNNNGGNNNGNGGSGFANFMSDIIGGGGSGGGSGGGNRSRSPPPIIPQRPPPAPIATKGPNAPPPPIRPGSRPDLTMGLGNMGASMTRGGVELNEFDAPVSEPRKRPEMKGPTSDVSNLLAGLKTKTINIQPTAQPSLSDSVLEDIGETISVSDLKDMSQDSAPHKTKRRPRSERNTISLDI